MTSSKLGLLGLAAGAVAGALAAWVLVGHGASASNQHWGPRSGRVEFTITGEPGMNLERLTVAVMQALPGGGRRASHLEGVHLDGGRGSLELPEGAYELWVGAGLSPESRGPRIVPRLISVTVRPERPVFASASLIIGGVVAVPPSLGLPGASYGRLRVRCSQGPVTTKREIALRPDDRTSDMVWPPLPVGEWDMVVSLSNGATARLHARVARDAVVDAELARR